MQIVDVYNKGAITLTLTNNGDRYDIPVDGHKIVPYDCAASAFGDPRARDTGRDRGRSNLYDHIRGMWNYNLGFDTAADWDEKRPKFEAYDVNSGERIWFVIDDPFGDKVAVELGDSPRSSAPSDTALVAEQMAAMQAQIAALTTQLSLAKNVSPAGLTTANGAEQAAPEVVTESVTTTPVATATLELPTVPDVAAKVTADGPKATRGTGK